MHRIKILTLLSIMLLSTNLYSQKRKDKVEYLSNFDKKAVRWGFYLGLNRMDYRISYKAEEYFPEAIDRIETTPRIGFNVGLIGDIRLHNNINIRIEPGLATNNKKIYFKYLNTAQDSVRKASGTYMHVPLLVQFSANRYKNIRPYVIGGVTYDHNFAGNFDNINDNSSGEFRMQKHNFMYEVGIGMDFYLVWFKFSPSIRGVFAINNELKRDAADLNSGEVSPWTTPIDYFGTRGIFLRFAFQ